MDRIDACSTTERARRVQKNCEIMTAQNSTRWAEIRKNTETCDYKNALLVSREHKLIVCFPSKAGSGTFKELLVMHTAKYLRLVNTTGRNVDLRNIHKSQFNEGFGIKPLSAYNKTEIAQFLQNYTKVMVVRNPLVRVHSSYRDKLVRVRPPKCQPFQKRLGTKIVQELRTNVTESDLECAHDVTFSEFMRYFSKHQQNIQRDPHWASFYDTCRPCDITYDHILRLETGSKDTQFFVSNFLKAARKVNETTSSVRLRNQVGDFNERALQERSFQKLYTEYESVRWQDFDAIYSAYLNDMTLFGYQARLTDNGVMTSCLLEGEKGRCC